MPDDARWWTFRPAQNLSASVYICPLCGERLPALSEHMLISPEGDTTRRRHAHTACVWGARRSGDLVTRDEWEGSRPETISWWRRIIDAVRCR